MECGGWGRTPAVHTTKVRTAKDTVEPSAGFARRHPPQEQPGGGCQQLPPAVKPQACRWPQAFSPVPGLLSLPLSKLTDLEAQGSNPGAWGDSRAELSSAGRGQPCSPAGAGPGYTSVQCSEFMVT